MMCSDTWDVSEDFEEGVLESTKGGGGDLVYFIMVRASPSKPASTSPSSSQSSSLSSLQTRSKIATISAGWASVSRSVLVIVAGKNLGKAGDCLSIGLVEQT